MALKYPQNGDLTKSLKSARKKVPQSARLSAGGVQLLLGQCPNRGDANFSGASLKQLYLVKMTICQKLGLKNHTMVSTDYQVQSYNGFAIFHTPKVPTSTAIWRPRSPWGSFISFRVPIRSPFSILRVKSQSSRVEGGCTI